MVLRIPPPPKLWKKKYKWAFEHVYLWPKEVISSATENITICPNLRGTVTQKSQVQNPIKLFSWYCWKNRISQTRISYSITTNGGQLSRPVVYLLQVAI